MLTYQDTLSAVVKHVIQGKGITDQCLDANVANTRPARWAQIDGTIFQGTRAYARTCAFATLVAPFRFQSKDVTCDLLPGKCPAAGHSDILNICAMLSLL